MYLKTIEVQGFKSFYHKMRFEFKPGITAIVGPNGSGKSNIADAVRWVLGEQSARQLRGARMEDVIFSGTETRKPVGFAFVALTLDNQDHLLPIEYSEVTVSRRVYQSGESEYQINGKTCRLRDVQELFFDTGIGKEGYSIIGQGQVEQILSSKPEERREIFDEAAGIGKFKKRKAQAERKLEAEQIDLSRITDILSEMERQLGPLKRQSETARTYLSLRDELRDLDVGLFVQQLEQAEKERQDLAQKKTIAQEDYDRNQLEYEELKEKYQKTREEEDALEAKLSREREKLQEQNLRQEQLEGEIRLLAGQREDYAKQKAQIKERMEAAAARQKERRQQAAQTGEKAKEQEESFATFRKALEKSADEIETLSAQIEASSKQKEAGYDKVLAILDTDSQMRADLEKNQALLSQTESRQQELQGQITSRQEILDRLYEEKKQGEEALNRMNRRIARYQISSEVAQEEKQEGEKQLDQIRSALSKKREEQQRCRLKAETLRNLSERYEGYGGAVRHIMSRKDRIPGVCGVVADLIQVEAKYETAIEVALGGSMQHIVTETENCAKAWVSYLKREQAGRATFLPLDSVKGRGAFSPREALKEAVALGTAASLVQFDPKYRRVFDSLLGRILVVDTLEHALTIARQYRFTLRIVTLEGDLLAPGGALTGGKYRYSDNLLGRGRELEELAHTEEQLQREIASLQKKEREWTASCREKEEILQENKTALAECKTSYEVAKTQLDQTIEAVEHQNRALQAVTAEYEELEQSRRELENQIDRILRSRRTKDQQNQSENEKIEQVNQELGRLQEQLDQSRNTHVAQQLSCSEAEQNLKFLNETKSRLLQEAEDFSREEEALKLQLQRSGEEEKAREVSLSQAEVALEETKKCRKSQNKKVEELSTRKAALSAAQKEAFDRREELSAICGSLDKEIFRLASQLERMEANLQSLNDYMWEEYQLTYGNAKAMLNPSLAMTPGQMRKRSGEIKAQIKELGPVNVSAIEEYKEVSARYQEMDGQRQDLVQAGEALQGIIQELEEQMRQIFSTQFAAINAEFDKVFQQLFGGGHGRLELMEEGDLLSAGVRIIAQPPGKKLQNMMMLSGGEKALTAICILFAILNLKPSPFCLLDEIEAALDDNNVRRFARYLERLSKTTQFIVITHRRGTMTAADVLYGITMQEKGISTMVSVNLIADQLEGEAEKTEGNQ